MNDDGSCHVLCMNICDEWMQYGIMKSALETSQSDCPCVVSLKCHKKHSNMIVLVGLKSILLVIMDVHRCVNVRDVHRSINVRNVHRCIKVTILHRCIHNGCV